MFGGLGSGGLRYYNDIYIIKLTKDTVVSSTSCCECTISHHQNYHMCINWNLDIP